MYIGNREETAITAPRGVSMLMDKGCFWRISPRGGLV